MSTLRRLLAALLVLGGLAALAVGVPTAWVKHTVLDTDRYTAAVAPLIAEPAVQATVSTALVEAVTSRTSVPEPLVGPLTTAVSRVVASDAFVPVWERAVRESHEHALAALRGEGRGFALDEGTLSVELAPLVAALVPRLEAAGIPGAGSLERVDGSVELVSSPELARAARAAEAVDRWGTAVLVLGVAMLVAAVLVSPRRGATLVWAGLGVVAVSAVHRLAWQTVTGGAQGEGASDHGTARLVVAALGEGVGGLVTTVAAVGGVAVVLGVAVLLASRRRG